MSHKAKRDRAKLEVFRGGKYIPRAEYDRQQRAIREQQEALRLRRLGLTRAKPKILTLEEIAKERRPIRNAHSS